MKPLDPALWPHLRPARRALAAATAATVLDGALLVAQAFAVASLVVGLATRTSIAAAAVAVIVIFALRGLLGVVVDVATAGAAGEVSTHLRRRALRAGLGDRRRPGEVALLVTRGLAATEPWFTRYLPSLLVAAVVPLLTLAVIAWLDPLSGLVVVLTLPLVPIFAALVGLSTRDRAQRQWRLLQSLSGHFLDVVRGLPTLAAHRRAAAQVDTIRTVTHRVRRASLDTLRLAFASSVVLELLATLSVALVAVVVGLRLAHGSIDFHTALTVLLLAPEAYWPLRRVGAEFHAAAEGAAAFAEIDLVAGATPDRTAASSDEIGVVLDDVSLSWGDRVVVRDLTARMGPGLTAIVGPSGAGKSTVLAAIVGELRPESGSVRVEGLSDVDQWRPHIAWVPQRPWLQAGSIADNLRVADETASDAQLWRALERVDLAHVVLTLPAGLNTELGEDGGGLSAGERARLALARVLLSQRPIVVLDEPTAHLDAATEEVITRVVGDLARSRTVIVVAHRQRLIDLADQVIAIEPLTVEVGGAGLTAPTPQPPSPDSASTWQPSRRAEFLAVALGALSASCGVALTATAGWLITRASEQPPVLMLMVAIVGVRAFGLGRPVLRYAERLLSHEQALGRLAERRAEVYAALVPLVPARLGVSQRRRGDLLTSLVDDVDALVDARVRVRVPLWTTAVVSVLALALAVLVAPAAALVLLLPIVATAVLAVVVARSSARTESDLVDARAELSAVVEATLSDARHLIAWQRDAAAVDEAMTASGQLALITRQASVVPSFARALLMLATGAAVAMMPVAVGGTTPAMGALFVLLPLAMLEVLSPAIDAASVLARCAAATARIDALVAQDPAVDDPARPLTWPSPRPRVSADGVGVVDTVSFVLDPGDHVGLVGPSGSGKSTIAAQLIRFLDPPGEVAFDGVDARDLRLDDVRGHVALVDDDPYLFSSSVVENIRLARPGATDEDVRRALKVAGLGDWVDQVGLHTLIGAGHRDVSGGERARLGLARAVLAQAPIVVLDEPTAHLDTATAQAVTADLLAALADRSVLWITHEPVGLPAMGRVIDLTRTDAGNPA